MPPRPNINGEMLLPSEQGLKVGLFKSELLLALHFKYGTLDNKNTLFI